MKKKLLLLLCLMLCLALAGCSPDNPPESALTEEPVATTAPVEAGNVPGTAESTAETTDAPAATQEPAKAYLVVTAHGYLYDPIPLYTAGRYRITFGDNVNVVEVTEDSIRMAESTCANQDCVEQGTVTLENRGKRVLQNMIICLPNDVALELYTYEEVVELMQAYAGGQVE
ncbi:MAG: NusG domain II-containing protein [Aristaeellaceae bacterium]